MIQDFQSSGLIDLAARKYRVIAFDRPGFGHSERPRNTVWTPEAQAGLIGGALVRIGASEAMVLGHSWGTLVAVALALRIPAKRQGADPGLRILLPDRSSRRVALIGAGRSVNRGHSKPHRIADLEQVDVAVSSSASPHKSCSHLAFCLEEPS
jgi:pimeloyl-ACP methyl ester carboxylesterase